MLKNADTLVFLYTRLPDYFYQCALFFANRYGYKIFIVTYKADINTNYSFEGSENVKLVYKDDLRNIRSFIEDTRPRAIYVAGWGDKDYKAAVKNYRNTVPVIFGLDNPWKSLIKQKLFCLLSPWMLHPYFNKVWVAGAHQLAYALRLGYEPSNVLNGLYAADSRRYADTQYLSAHLEKKVNYPRVLLFVGRLVDYKNPILLAEVFQELKTEEPVLFGDWKLVIAGEGPLRNKTNPRNSKDIILKNFISPKDLPAVYLQSGVFCLPSIDEHWGVVVHEAALAGLPLLLSDSVYSGYEFLIDGYNGLRFQTKDRTDLKRALAELMKTKGEILWEMGQRSKQLATRISLDTWAAELNAVL